MADTCRSCSAEIEWAVTTNGRPIPLDLERHPYGNITLDDAGVAQVVVPGEGDRSSHFATCPDAARFRRKAKR